MSRRDLKFITIIGAAVGILIQPILTNTVLTDDSNLAVRGAIFVFFLAFAPFALWVASLLARVRWGTNTQVNAQKGGGGDAGDNADRQPLRGIYQFAQFAAVGTLNTFIDVGVFNLETFFYGSSLIGNGLFAAFKAVSFLCGTTNSFFWNKYWTFNAGDGGPGGGASESGVDGGTKQSRTKQTASFYAIAAVGWVLNVGMATLIKTLGTAGMGAAGAPGVANLAGARIVVNLVAPLAGVAASFLWDFLGYKFWVFKK